MSEEVTKNLPNESSFEERVFAEFRMLNSRLTTLETRLTTLEDKVDARLRETRPIWEAMKAQLDRVESKLDLVAADLLETRTDQALRGPRASPSWKNVRTFNTEGLERQCQR